MAHKHTPAGSSSIQKKRLKGRKEKNKPNVTQSEELCDSSISARVFQSLSSPSSSSSLSFASFHR